MNIDATIVLIFSIITVSVISQDNATRDKDLDITKRSFHLKKRNITTEEQQKFADWKKANHKNYASKRDEQKARNLFTKNSRKINEHNKDVKNTYKRKLMADADKPFDEQKKYKFGLKKPLNNRRKLTSMNSHNIKQSAEIPDAIDFRKSFGPIKDQSDCGACWAFSVTSVLEFWNIQNGGNRTNIFSEQELIDCNGIDMGCGQGGWPSFAYAYVKENGISSGNQYRFLGYGQLECNRNKFPVVYNMTATEYCEVELKGDEELLRHIVAKYGPVIVVFHATESFASYQGGIFYEPFCPQHDENHAIVIVGYGTDINEQLDFWIIRNSWGYDFGVKGYGRFARNLNNTCGIATTAMFPCNDRNNV